MCGFERLVDCLMPNESLSEFIRHYSDGDELLRLASAGFNSSKREHEN